MGDVVISVENVWKQYRLGLVGTGSLGNDLKRWFHKARGLEDPFLKIGEVNDRAVKGKSDYVWALQDINFEVKQGEVLGIIGKNGAGKSTLLKILSRVTTQSKGEIKVKGRIASLLEVGTGFHPDLTGKENVFLNGAIMGMKKAEILSKFDEIVDFSGIERYIDTPVKKYSSGMYVRLAFAVAAHLEPEILIIDEVLAVGDAEFQKKCLGKMNDVSTNEGRTILFVSHSMLLVQSLCKTGIYLKNGMIFYAGSKERTIESYTEDESRNAIINVLDRSDRVGSGTIRFKEIVFLNGKKNAVDSFFSGDEMVIVLKFNAVNVAKNVEIAIAFKNNFGLQVAMIANSLIEDAIPEINKNGRFVFKVPRLSLVSGKYTINIFCKANNEIADWVIDAAGFSISIGDYYQTGRNSDSEQSVFLMDFKYNTEFE